jgi:hypothetical protein
MVWRKSTPLSDQLTAIAEIVREAAPSLPAEIDQGKLS